MSHLEHQAFIETKLDKIVGRREVEVLKVTKPAGSVY